MVILGGNTGGNMGIMEKKMETTRMGMGLCLYT